MIVSKSALTLAVCMVVCFAARAKPDDADRCLKQALHFADLYNWSDAAPLFSRAEQLYNARGDARNAFYAHLGRLRSTMEQLSLPEASEELGAALEANPLLQSDLELRLFCLTVRGDMDGELDSEPMRRDWEEALQVARALGDKKWENRASGEIGFSLFLEGEMGAAREKVSGALIGAMMMGDIGAQIRYLAAIGQALVQLDAYDDALAYFDKALKIAAANPDTGYQFFIQQGRLQAMRGKGELDAAQRLADEILEEARTTHRYVKETIALITASTLAVAGNQDSKAITELQAAVAMAQKGGFTRLLADAQFHLADIFRKRGDLAEAEVLAASAAESTLTSGDLYLLPPRLQTLAELQVSRRKYQDADATYDRASDLLDTMIGNVKAAPAKIGLVTSMSAIYAEHFALAAEHLNDTAKAYAVVEHARGRVSTELLMSGRPPNSPQELEIQKKISRWNVALTKAKSEEQVRQIRDNIFLAEEGRWLVPTPGARQSQPWQTIPLDRVREVLAPNTLLLEYVLAEPQSFCVVIRRNSAHIVSLAGRRNIEDSVAAYLKTLKARAEPTREGRELYELLLNNIPEAAKTERLIIVPDGQLHLLPFDALVDRGGRYLAYSRIITYAPSATAFYLASLAPQQSPARALLGVGGLPYDQAAELNKLATMRGYSSTALVNLPGSKDEVLAAEAYTRDGSDTLLMGKSATKFAFEHAGLDQYAIIHLAVHGFANEKHPEKAALLLLSDAPAGDDGILDAGEIVRLHSNADLVVLSACDTAVGSLEGQEGIANLSLAFLLSGAKSVVSTLWSIDDTSTLYLMKRFYAHLAEGESAAVALTAAKRDMLKTYGAAAIPYYWASFRLDGLGDRPIYLRTKKLTSTN
jgi:CHAT domain-containing protein